MRQHYRDTLYLYSGDDLPETIREALPAFYEEVFERAGWSDAAGIGLRLHDFLDDTHPGSLSGGGVLCLVDESVQQPVAALVLIPQQWSYSGIVLPV